MTLRPGDPTLDPVTWLRVSLAAATLVAPVAAADGDENTPKVYPVKRKNTPTVYKIYF